jgi:hypothetical protein
MGFHTMRGFGTERSLAEGLGEGEAEFVLALAEAEGEAPMGTVLPVQAAASNVKIRSTKLLRAQKVYWSRLLGWDMFPAEPKPPGTHSTRYVRPRLYVPGSRGQKYVHRADGVYVNNGFSPHHWFGIGATSVPMSEFLALRAIFSTSTPR